MAGDDEAPSCAEVVPISRGRTLRWRRLLPVALLVSIVLGLGTPLFGLLLLTAVLAAPILVTTTIVLAARRERDPGAALTRAASEGAPPRPPKARPPSPRS